MREDKPPAMDRERGAPPSSVQPPGGATGGVEEVARAEARESSAEVGVPAPKGAIPPQPAPERARPGRFAALDLLRFLAVVLMVQGHTFREVLDLAIREERWHGYHNYIHGYTAPIFLFSSGLAFGITTFRTWDKHLGWGVTLAKRLERYALLLLIGYAIHMPQLSLAALLRTPPEQLSLILKVDALQNIGVMLAIAELSVVVLRTPKRFVRAMASLGVVLVLIAPAVWRIDVSGTPLFFAAYVNAQTGSIFPLAPWGAFLLSGVLTAYILWDPARRAVRPNSHIGLFALGMATLVLGDYLAHAQLDGVWGEHNFWKTSPYFFLIRIGVVWMVLSLLAFAATRFPRLRGKQKGLVQTLGSETLVIYVAHLFVLYGTPFTPGVVRMVGPTLSPLDSTLLFCSIFVAMGALAYVWHEVKTRFPVPFNYIRRAITVVLMLMFLLKGWR